MPKTKAVSPARSQGANTTPKRKSTRGSRSLCSPALSTTSGRLTSIIDQFKDKNMESFALSPLNRRSVLNDNTEIEEPRRKSWWKKLDENSQDVMEVLEDNKLIVNNAIDEFIDIDVLSQEKKNVTLDIPDSSDNESINSIVLPQRRLFTQKENQPQKKFGQLIDNRESLAKLHKINNTNIDKTVNVGTRELFRNAKRSKPIFPAALLNISPNKTTADKTKENVLADPKPQVRNIFGNRLGTKRKNMFADFIVSESEDEISDIQPRVFGFQNKIEQRRISSVSRGRDPSPTSSITTDIEMDFRNMLPSSTMVENQLDEMMVSTPVKRARLSKLSEAKESEAGTLQTNSTGEKSRQSNKSVSSKNKSKASPEIRNKSLNSSRTTKSMLKNASKRENMEDEGKRNESEKMEAEENDDESQEVEAEENKSQQTKNESQEVNAEVNESQEIAEEANESQEVEDDQDDNNEEMLPSTTMVENQVEGMIVSTPVKRSKLSKLSEAIESETGSNTLQANTTGDKTRQSNKYFPSKNKSKASPEIRDKSMNSSRTTRSMLKNASKHEDTSVQNKVEEMVEQEIEEDTNNSRDDKTVEKEHEPDDEINISQENKQEANESEENDDEVNVSQKDDDVQNESQEVDNEDNESEEYRLRYNDSDDNNEETNESQHVEADVNVSQGANESQEVVEDVDESHEPDEVEEAANESQEIEAEANESEEEANESQEVEAEANESEVVEEEANESQEVEDEVNESREVEDEVNESQEVEAEANESQEVEAEANESQEVEEEADESQEVEDEVNESQEVEAEANESQDVQEEANESQEVEDDQDENAEVMSEDEEEAVNESQVNEASANESQEVENDEEESQNEVASEAEDEDVEDDQQMDESDEADKAIASDPEISDDNQADEMEVDDDEEQESENESEQNEHESHEEQNEIEASEEIEESPNVTHDTTGRHRKKHLSTSPEVMLKDKTKQMDSFTVKGRNTSIRKTASLAPHRNSTGFSDGTKNSSAEGSGWDSHRTTRKTLRQTFGKDFTPRKSLRALVMEKSAKRQTEHMEMHSETVKFPLANSTEMPEDSARHDDDIMESDHELSRRTRLSALEMALQKIKEQNIEKRLKLEAAVRNSLKNPPTSSLSLFKVPNKPAPRRLKPAQNKHKKQLKSVIPLDELPAEVIQDMKYKPPKRFRPSNASWITKRLYKFFEDKLEAKYDYKARVRSEKLAETLYNFTKDLRRHNVAPTDAVEVLKHEFARLNIVRTHFEFYEFFHEFMPTEIRVKVVPDIINKIPLPRHGVFSDILRE